MQQQQTISQSDCDVRQKVNFIRQLATTSSVAGPRKAAPKPNLHQKKVMVTGGLLPIWSTTAFWIPVKLLHLRSTLSKSMRYTENCNACSQHWSTERDQFSSRTAPKHTSHNPHQPLPLLQACQQLFAGKMLPRWAGGRKCFPIICQIPKHGFLCYRDKQTFLVGKNVLIVMVPILINKDVFESSYNDNWNCSCFSTNLIHELTPRICTPDLKELKIQQNFD